MRGKKKNPNPRCLDNIIFGRIQVRGRATRLPGSLPMELVTWEVVNTAFFFFFLKNT